MLRMIALLPLSAFALLAACSHSAPPASPAADAATQPAATSENTQLRDTIQKPINKAKGVEGTVEKSFENQNAQLNAAEGA
ncbi:MAG: hypothetical protein JSS03_04345, partial [Proteobacteria bacterium]|nr:hypothetical protein [Pseudomonadota bacterium]